MHHSPQARRLCIVTGQRCTTARSANPTSRARARSARSACTSRVGWPSSRACPDDHPIGACSVHARLYKSPPVSRACQGDSGAGCGSSWPLSREPAALAARSHFGPARPPTRIFRSKIRGRRSRLDLRATCAPLRWTCARFSTSVMIFTPIWGQSYTAPASMFRAHFTLPV